ncbi:MAG TPA: vitamin K epoxide reductase family protein, partial [Polyangiaceae bacterium]
MDDRESFQKYPKRWWAGVLLALTGFAVAFELTRIHVNLASDPTHQSFCNINEQINCDAVAASSYAIALGLPLSVWGMFGYASVLVVAVWGLRSKRLAPVALLFLLGCICVGTAIYNIAVSAFALRTLCVLCSVTWAIDLGLFVVAKSLVKHCGLRTALHDWVDWCREHLVLAGGLAAVGITVLALAYRSFPHAASASQIAEVHAASAASVAVPEGVDESGLPYVGAAHPKLVITEYSDYQCPHCARAHEQLRELVARYPNAVRVVHRHFPLDNDCNPKISRPFHTHACYYARLAVCSATLSKFWIGNDYLFSNGRRETSLPIESFARAIG